MKPCNKRYFILLLVFVLSCQSQAPRDLHLAIQEIAGSMKTPAPVHRVDDMIKYGETLSSILRKHEIEPYLINQIISNFHAIYHTKQLKANDKYFIEKDSSGTFLKFVYVPSLEKQYIVSKDTSGKITTTLNEIPLEKRITSVKGQLSTTLYDAVLELGETPELLIAISDIFQWDIDFFNDPRPGDEFKIIYEIFLLPPDATSLKSEKERFVRYGKILTAQYQLQEEYLTAIYFDNTPKDAGYYSLDGESFQKTFLKSPLNYRRISSHFSYSRKHPILKIVRPHYGMDFAAPEGTPISAAADGMIIEKNYDHGIGNYIKIRHKNPRFVTLYGHLHRFATGMEKGKYVKQKDVIGYVGKTGLATGPHLHYTFYENGRPINPLKIKNSSGDPITKDNAERFLVVRDEMLSYLAKLDEVNIPLIRNLAMLVHFNRYQLTAP